MVKEYDNHKLLVANRGEIAVRILQTAKRLGLKTVAIYTHSDSLSPHVLQADESVPLEQPESTVTNAGSSEAAAYLSITSIIQICIKHSVTLVHPGYGFLSENAKFAAEVINNGIIWLGPRPEIIRSMGLKHEALDIARNAGLKSVPGSGGLLASEEEALNIAAQCGYPVLLKATAGGGGMGMIVCRDAESLRTSFQVAKNRAKTLFHDDGIFLERYFDAARHIEIQVFGNGQGDVVHMRERECSAQRRHQKVIEESPSPFCLAHPGLREQMCDAAVSLAKSIKYNSAGTMEFLVDEETANFYFLEMNTRIQVEHPVTEQIHPGLDLVELMIKQGLEESSSNKGFLSSSAEMQQATYDNFVAQGVNQGCSHAIESRIYAENPYEGFVPSPGLVQYASINELDYDWLRIDSWVETGMTITPHFDPLMGKVIVSGSTREEALSRSLIALGEIQLLGPMNNVKYLSSIIDHHSFRTGMVTTTFLESFKVQPRAFKVLSPGIDTTIQDLPGRHMKLGIPVSGPMDSLAFSAANILVGNPKTTEGLEIVVVPGVKASFHFFTSTVIAVAGKDVIVKVSGKKCSTWSKLLVPEGSTVDIEASMTNATAGFRVYLAIRGGFPDVPTYLGSKSTSMGLGGYQGRSLLKGDLISLGNCSPAPQENEHVVPEHLVPTYSSHWVIYVLPGPHGDEEFVTSEGLRKFYTTRWRVSPSSNRLGIRLEPPSSADRIAWARESGGEGGSHPSNILDNGYALGTININGDTPVILTNEGPDMGGYMCLCTVATAEMWKLGQLGPGNTIEFRRISWSSAIQRSVSNIQWLEAVEQSCSSHKLKETSISRFTLLDTDVKDTEYPTVLHVRHVDRDALAKRVTFRQAGGTAILVEFGAMHLDLFVRARIHAFQGIVNGKGISGLRFLCPCIRSILCHYDPTIIAQDAFLAVLIESAELIPDNMDEMTFPGRRITFPIVLDDKWNKEAILRYMTTTRDKAVYLPSNVEYLANNNGLASAEEALQKLVESDWLVLGVGFYLACPFLIPVDPRCRLIGQKMNPSRTFTPRGAIGIAGPVAAIYPIESPGGYQLYGRTLPTWQTWGKGRDFQANKPWLLEAFDQVAFKPVSEHEYIEFEKQFDTGQYVFQIEPTEFSVAEYAKFLESIEKETQAFCLRQAEASSREEQRERILLREWEEHKVRQNVQEDSSKSVYNGYSSTNAIFFKDNLDVEGGSRLTAPIFANIWKIQCSIDDVIESDSQVLVILEAMKTEIPVLAGEGSKGKKVVGFGHGAREGQPVGPGDTLVILG
ncbi:Putative urea carboxylase [Psilocybe cubensis]|uniref:Urea carboxylase n=1 Tax=Psilocybe cubensis TaxID=181762 RepID=A0ACB8GJB1_PSICU|nr:Putative urea carboxylase [Psilocybe cubensis]KAH9475545.1 Putative urea carboxylase [Psilocybe cubensis]